MSNVEEYQIRAAYQSLKRCADWRSPALDEHMNNMLQCTAVASLKIFTNAFKPQLIELGLINQEVVA